MQNNSVLWQARVLFALTLLNFLAQIPYFIHLYLGRQSLVITLRSCLIMGSVLAFFLIASYLLFTGRRPGYALMLIFLAVEFLFYLFGVISSTIRGLGPFFQVRNPDVILRIVYSIGYVNLFVAGYFLVLLLRHKSLYMNNRQS